MMTGFGMGFGLLGPILMLLFWGGLILLGLWLVRALFQGRQHTRPPSPYRESSPREILDLRYARGEITRQQYELMKDDIA